MGWPAAIAVHLLCICVNLAKTCRCAAALVVGLSSSGSKVQTALGGFHTRLHLSCVLHSSEGAGL